jgi:hypothetical protein
MYEMYIEKVLFPVTPGKLSVKISNKNKTLTLINEGEVNLVKTPGLTDITIDELVLPAFQKYPFARYKNNKFQSAQYYLEKLETWKKKKKPVQFKLLRPTPGGVGLLWDTSFDVTVEDYEIIEDAENQGLDVKVKLVMKQYRNWGVKKLKKKKNGKYTKGKPVKRKTKEKAKFYTVKEKDTLLKIARKELGSGADREALYALNKKVIEKAAKEHGRKSSSKGKFLYKGTKLKLPRTETGIGLRLDTGTGTGKRL